MDIKLLSFFIAVIVMLAWGLYLERRSHHADIARAQRAEIENTSLKRVCDDFRGYLKYNHCPVCGGILVQGGADSLDDVTGNPDDEGRTVYNYTCQECGAYVEVTEAEPSDAIIDKAWLEEE